jgi:NAD(P)H-nitrite reductase large subunit
VLIAAGVRPEATLAQQAGIQVERGIVVDDHMATSAPDVYAAGDVAVYKGYSWAIAPIAQAQARVAAANMAGDAVAYDVVVPSTTLKVVGIDVSSVGIVNPEEGGYREFHKLDKEAGTYKKIVLRDDIIVGCIVINDRALAKELEKKIAARAPLSEARRSQRWGKRKSWKCVMGSRGVVKDAKLLSSFNVDCVDFHTGCVTLTLKIPLHLFVISCGLIAQEAL